MSEPRDTGLKTAQQHAHSKGLSIGSIGALGAVVIGVSTIAPAYTLSGALGPTASAVGDHLPAVLIIGFLPMLLVALGYRQLNRAMPDAGTTFTWASKSFGPWIGWMGSWGLLAATILVLSNLAGIAVDFFYLAISQITGVESIAELTRNVPINVITCVIFMAAAAYVSYRGMETTKTVQYVLVSFQVLVLLWFAVAAFRQVSAGSAFDATAFSWEWFNPFGIESFSAFSAGIALSVFIYWGWDVVLTMNEESRGTTTTPGRAAILTILVVVSLYTVVTLGALTFSGVSDGEFGLGNPDIQENVFAALAGPVMGPMAILMSLAVLSSSAASLQSTMISPARTMLAMGHYGALNPKYSKVSPRYQTPAYATVVAVVIASVFYVVMRIISENVLWDTITTLGMMVCFYYGITALACVWYFRGESTASFGDFFNKLLAPLVGGILLLVFFFQTIWDSMDPEYGSGSEIGGVGLVFILGMLVFTLGIAAMFWQYHKRPEFFRRRFETTEFPTT
ncbi:APC family permease [Nesterenkonia sandarakina]|uniref:Amino acid/polyamine/organocation transporter (APC superfamily) n=1 Tax=Nesterenkonia sandarakina TaxID=272918 RepID=A0A2T0YRM6_9MICC|nr:APC family permease [Nesterenkonia sandarakina]PRZ18181.1 amino acid/polyamine/organocation transporter (APC superfamily) [Nesterenkonia sandarakina]